MVAAFSPDGEKIAYAAALDIGHAWGGDAAKVGIAQQIGGTLRDKVIE